MFDKYLPINTNGNYKKVYITSEEDVLDFDIETNALFNTGKKQIVKRVVPIWLKDRNESTTSFVMNRVKTDPIVGTYIGSFKKKLKRTYKRAVTAEEENEILDYRRRLRTPNSVSNAPHRLDNPYKLDEIAIIAVSNTKRYAVSMNDLFLSTFHQKFKVL